MTETDIAKLLSPDEKLLVEFLTIQVHGRNRRSRLTPQAAIAVCYALRGFLAANPQITDAAIWESVKRHRARRAALEVSDV